MNEGRRAAWRLGRNELLLIFIFWTSLAGLSAVNRLLDPRGGLQLISPFGPIFLGFVEAWLWAALTPLIFWLSSRFSVERGNWYRNVPVLLFSGVAIAILVYATLWFARTELLPPFPRRRGGGLGTFTLLRFGYLNHLLVYFAVLAAGFAREFFLRDRQRQREAVELQTQAAQLQAQLSDARLEALRMQINPHFLFNTLHAISALVERDPAGVRRMIARLSELLRTTIETRAADQIPLSEELDFVERYLEIMEIRFQGRLHVERRIEPDTLRALVPNLILQPVVENALEHGVSQSSSRGRVEIVAQREGEQLILAVRDNGPGPGASKGSGVGLANIRARLQQLYGEAASFSAAAADGGGFLAEIRIPYQEAPPELIHD